MEIKENDKVKFTSQATYNIKNTDNKVHTVKSVNKKEKTATLENDREVHINWLTKMQPEEIKVIAKNELRYKESTIPKTPNVELHLDCCKKFLSSCPTHNNLVWANPYNYEFEYGYKTYVVRVNSCFSLIDLYRHQTIVETAVKQMLGEKIDVRSCQCIYRGYLHGACGEIAIPSGYSLRRNKRTGLYEQTIEVVSNGGSGNSWNYFVIHEIKDINIEEVFNQKNIDEDSDKYKNLQFLARLLERQDLLDKLHDNKIKYKL